MENQNQLPNTAKSMNEALVSLYENRLPELNYQIEQCIEECGWTTNEISKLFFMQVDDEYLNAPKKILFIGRETFGWEEYNKLDTADALMNLYKDVATYGRHYNSPFWWFREKLSQELKIDAGSFMRSTLWTNLSKIDVNKTTPTGARFGELSQLFVSLLVAEIDIVKPDVILILTTNGHYKWHLDHYRWLANEPFKAFSDATELIREPILSKKIDRLIAPDRLPLHTYQLCRPNALRRKVGGYTKNADELINTLSALIQSPETH